MPGPRGPQRLVARPRFTDFIPLKERRGARGCGAGSGLAEAGEGAELGVVPAVVGTPSRRSLQEPDRVLMPRSRKGGAGGTEPCQLPGVGSGQEH